MQQSTAAASQQVEALAAALAAGPALSSAVSPVAAQQLDVDTFCAAGEDLQPMAVSNDGWDWVEEGRHDCRSPGCRKFGYKSVTPGARMVFKFDTSGILSKEQLRDKGKLSLVMLFLKQQSYAAMDGSAAVDGMGIVRLRCEEGCSCKALEVNGENSDRTAELDTVQTQVRHSCYSSMSRSTASIATNNCSLQSQCVLRQGSGAAACLLCMPGAVNIFYTVTGSHWLGRMYAWTPCSCGNHSTLMFMHHYDSLQPLET
jgi:hypothetical protein